MQAGDEVKQKLLVRGWTLTRLAERIGVSLALISFVVNGKRISPFLQTAVAEVVGLPAEEIFGPLFWKNFVHRKYSGLRAIPPRRGEGISV